MFDRFKQIYELNFVNYDSNSYFIESFFLFLYNIFLKLFEIHKPRKFNIKVLRHWTIFVRFWFIMLWIFILWNKIFLREWSKKTHYRIKISNEILIKISNTINTIISRRIIKDVNLWQAGNTLDSQSWVPEFKSHLSHKF